MRDFVLQIAAKINLPANILLLLLASAVILIAWSFAVPLGEAPDEGSHAQYVEYIRLNVDLPLYRPGFSEANQPPLYYSLVAPLAFQFATPTGWPHWVGFKPGDPRVTEYSSPDFNRYWAWRSIRLLTALLSVVTVLSCYWIGREASGDRMTGLLAAGLAAFLPQFTFRGTNISNDALVTLLSGIATLWIVRLIRSGFTWETGGKGTTALALTFLAKINAVFLPIPFSLAILSESVPWKTRVKRLGVLALALILIAPWLIRNQFLYNDPLANGAMLNVVSFIVDRKAITSPYFTQEFPSLLYRSFIGLFGWMNLPSPDWVYWLYGTLIVAALVGYVSRFFARNVDLRVTLILSAIPLLNLAVTVYINLTFSQPQGRYMFPAMPALAFLTAYGLIGLPAWSGRATLILLMLLALVNIYLLLGIVVPAYWMNLSHAFLAFLI